MNNHRYAIELAGEGPELRAVHQLLDHLVDELRARGHTVRRAVCTANTFTAASAAVREAGITVRPIVHDATPGENRL